MKPNLIIGIDPAPGKGAACVIISLGLDDKAAMEALPKLSHPELREKLKAWKELGSLLIAWDAPLTGPVDPNCHHAGRQESGHGQDFTQRIIERVFKNKVPLGISVQGYSGCQHWTISRNLFGLPVVGPYDQTNPEFTLLTERPASDNWTGGHVVEVHPAVAMWEWLKADWSDAKGWRYKGRGKMAKDQTKEDGMQIPERRATFLAELSEKWRSEMGLAIGKEVEDAARKSADVFDALVAAVLAYGWVYECDCVHLVGAKETGAWLLPKIENRDWREQCRQELDNVRCSPPPSSGQWPSQNQSR